MLQADWVPLLTEPVAAANIGVVVEGRVGEARGGNASS